MNKYPALALQTLFPGGPKPVTSRLWLPSDLAGLVFWVKADAITGLSDGDPISTWTDLSGAGHNVTAAGAQRPTYKTAILNGLPVARFNGSNNLRSAAFAHSQPYTVFAAGNETGAGLSYFVDDLVGGGHIVGGLNATTFGVNAGAWITPTVSNMANSAVMGGVFNGASSTASYQGTATAGNAGANNASGVSLGNSGGSSAPITGDMAEAMMYSAALSDANRQKLEGYLAWKWGLQGSLPGGHPYKSAAPTV